MDLTVPVRRVSPAREQHFFGYYDVPAADAAGRHLCHRVRFRSEACTRDAVDLRCDLHPRWMPGGLSVTFDSIHEGHRGVYWADLRSQIRMREESRGRV
jgi:hypothetical protein